MKTPRVADFDPHALPEEEAPHLGSPMDDLAKIERPSKLIETTDRVQAKTTSNTGKDDLKKSLHFHPNQDISARTIPTSKEGKKFTSKVVKSDDDPAVNKVGFYFTHHEIDALDELVTRLTPRLRDEFGIRATKNEVIRACLMVGLTDIEQHDFDSAVLKLITSK